MATVIFRAVNEKIGEFDVLAVATAILRTMVAKENFGGFNNNVADSRRNRGGSNK